MQDYLGMLDTAQALQGKWHAKMPKGWKAQDHFDEFHPIGRNPFYKKQPDGSLPS